VQIGDSAPDCVEKRYLLFGCKLQLVPPFLFFRFGTYAECLDHYTARCSLAPSVDILGEVTAADVYQLHRAEARDGRRVLEARPDGGRQHSRPATNRPRPILEAAANDEWSEKDNIIQPAVNRYTSGSPLLECDSRPNDRNLSGSTPAVRGPR
jgi:hypothetical protein